MSSKRACVVGAGFAGVAALKECVRQGFETTCYELDSDVGGIWRRKHGKVTNTPAVWETLVTNTSKFNNCYSDFPPDLNDSVYLHPEAMQRYLKRAVQHFGLEKHIHFNTRVIKIRKTKDHERTGQWEVYTTVSGNEIAGNDMAGPRGNEDALSKCHKEIFDFVLVCSGYFKVPVYPDIPGSDTFKGDTYHSFSYTSSKPFEGKNVLVVGQSFSGLDVAADVANCADQVYIAVGDGTWILPRVYPYSRPFDFLHSRSVMYRRDAEVKFNDFLIQSAMNNFDHEKSGMRPNKPPLISKLGLNDDLPLKLMTGKVKAFGHLARIDGDTAHFRDGKVISGINAIIFCTGFSPDFSFLDLELFQENGKTEWYKMVFPIHEKKHSLALIMQVGGDFPLFCLSETQARLATLVMAGKHELPTRGRMQKDIDFWNDHNFRRTGKYGSYFVSVAALLDSTAMEVGCYPSFWKVFLRNPTLALRNWYGPIMSAQFRLIGPDSQWDEAAKTCLSNYDEGTSSLRHKEVKDLIRPDIDEYRQKTYTQVFFTISVVAVVGFLAFRYKDNLSKYL